MAWGSTNQNKLKKLHNKQKHAARIICNEDRYSPSRPLMKKLNILNIYQLNIYQTLSFMFNPICTGGGWGGGGGGVGFSPEITLTVNISVTTCLIDLKFLDFYCLSI